MVGISHFSFFFLFFFLCVCVEWGDNFPLTKMHAKLPIMPSIKTSPGPPYRRWPSSRNNYRYPFYPLACTFENLPKPEHNAIPLLDEAYSKATSRLSNVHSISGVKLTVPTFSVLYISPPCRSV